MRTSCHNLLRAALAIALSFSALADVADRVAVVIGKKVITQSEVEESLRLTQFLNNQPLDLGPLARRDAAEHMIDQELIRQDMENGGYVTPAPSQADALLREFRQQHYPADAAYRAALQKYGITEAQLKDRLLWQLTAIQFTDFRFRPMQPEGSPTAADRTTTDGAGSVDQQMETWLKQARNDSRITLKPEAFK